MRTPLPLRHASKSFVRRTVWKSVGQSRSVLPGAKTATWHGFRPPSLGMHHSRTCFPACRKASRMFARTNLGASPMGAPSRTLLTWFTSPAQCSAIRTVFRQFTGSSNAGPSSLSYPQAAADYPVFGSFLETGIGKGAMARISSKTASPFSSQTIASPHRNGTAHAHPMPTGPLRHPPCSIRLQPFECWQCQ
jgi:hypothetical protein